jgi:hypothetical protein
MTTQIPEGPAIGTGLSVVIAAGAILLVMVLVYQVCLRKKAAKAGQDSKLLA